LVQQVESCNRSTAHANAVNLLPLNSALTSSAQPAQFSSTWGNWTEKYREFELSGFDQVLRQGHRAAGVATQAALHHI
jgi:hypothetical protein